MTMKIELNKPFKAKRADKKYSVYVKNEDDKIILISFGDINSKHYYDKIGTYRNMDHNDKEKRRLYKARASKNKDSKGRLTYKLKWSPNYWSYRTLW